jgi:lambda family phage tail tape measure protein
MAGDVIGSAVIEVTADATGLSAGIAQATQAVKGFETAAAASGARAGAAMSKANKEATITSAQLTREQERLISTINNYSTTVGRTRGEVLEYRAAQAGVTTQVQTQIAAIKAQEAALKSGGAELNRYGLSAKQNAAALRGVPAQVTDIVTSLQGGQAPLTVLLQQGGQLKDMFGGVVPAARALGVALLGLINPYTVVAAAVATLGVAYAQGSTEADNYRKALILTGNIAGTTAAQFQIMARNIDATVGTQQQAAEALAAIASTGRVAGTDLEKFGATAVRINRTVGTSIEDVAKQFEELGKDPVRASEKLNDSMNYLTLAVYDQIRAAQENGREQEAASIAQNAYADAMDKRTAKLEANLGIIQRAWRAVSDVAKEGWDQILGIGRPDGPGENAGPRWSAAAMFPMLLPGEVGRGLRGMIGEATTSDAERDAAAETRRLSARSATAEAAMERERAINNKMQIEARKRLEEQKKATRSRADQRADEIKQLDRDAKLVGLTSDEYNKRVAGINEKYKDPKGHAPKAFQDDAGTKYLMQLRETEASLKEQLSQNEKLTASQRELAKFEQQIADIKEKRTLTAEQKSLLTSQDAIRAQLEKNVSIENEVKAREKALKVQKEQEEAQKRFTERAAQIQDQIENTRTNRQEGYGRTLAAFGQSDQERQRLEDQQQLYRENERLQAQLTKATPKELLGSDQYIEEMVKIKGALDQSLADHNTYYEGLKAKQGDWLNGATRALGTYIDEVQNVSAATERAVTSGIKGIEDGFTELITTGKVTASKIGEQFFAEITRSIVKQQITGPLAEWLQGDLKSGDSIFGKLFGGLMSNKSTGESWLGGLLGTGGAKSATGAAGLGSVSASSSTASTALLSLAEAASAATYAMGGSSGGGGGGSSWISSLIGGVAGAFGGFDNGTATAMANASGGGLDDLFRFTNNFSGRAGGGYVGPRSVHEVAENGPELLTFGNKTLLMNGNQAGQVTPMKSGGRPVQVNNTFVLHQPASRETQAQISRRTGQSVDTAMRRNG